MVVKAKHIESTFLKAELIMTDYKGPDPDRQPQAASSDDNATATQAKPVMPEAG